MAATRWPYALKTPFPLSCVGITEIKVARKAFMRVCIALRCQSNQSLEEPARKCHLNVRPANTPVGHRGTGVVHIGLDFTMDTHAGAYTQTASQLWASSSQIKLQWGLCPRARAAPATQHTVLMV